MNLYGMLDAEKAMAGLLYGMNPKTIVSVTAKETINFGKGVFFNGARNAVLNGKHANKAVVDLSAYTTASKDIVLEINGVSITATAGTGTDAGKIFLVSDVDGELTVKLSYDGSDVTSSKVTASSDAVYAGVAVFHQNAFLDSRGCYIPTEAVNVMEKGYIWVVLAASVEPTVEADAYVTADGTFTTESSGNTKVGKFKSGKETGSNSDLLALVSLD